MATRPDDLMCSLFVCASVVSACAGQGERISSVISASTTTPPASEGPTASNLPTYASTMSFQAFGPDVSFNDPNIITLLICDFDCAQGWYHQGKQDGGRVLNILLRKNASDDLRNDVGITPGDYNVVLGRDIYSYSVTDAGPYAVAFWGTYNDLTLGETPNQVTGGVVHVEKIELTGPADAPTGGTLSGSFTLQMPVSSLIPSQQSFAPQFTSSLLSPDPV